MRWNLIDIRVAEGEARPGRIGCVVGHQFRHGIVPMYVVNLTRPVTLRTGERTRLVLLWESQIQPLVSRASRRTAALSARTAA